MGRCLVLLMLASLCFGLQKKGKPPKPPEITMIEVTCHRVAGDVMLDGRLKVSGDKPINKLQLLIDFLGTDGQLLQTKRGEVDSGTLDPNEETEFRMRVSDPIRAVKYALRLEDGNAKELRVDNAGPFPIE
ncbi:MAG TPA: hypothetical protein VM120_22710 [Bryobacteraceae bacterium]|nr:hypothetical protein [Bryobacteraceae bacterium]